MNLSSVLIAISAIGALMSIAMMASFSSLYDAILKKQLIIKEGSYSYGMWSELPDDLEMYMRLYYFNVTNSEEIKNREPGTPGPKPVLEEIGPYVWRERHYKDVIQWNENDTITFQQRKQWEFVPEESRSLDDVIVSVNIIALSAAEYARNQPENSAFYTVMINDLIEQENVTMFMEYTVRNWTFDGIVEQLIEFGSQTDSWMELPIPFDKFGWFYPRNDSADYDGTFSMHTGASSIMNVGQISEWNFKPNINENIYPKPCGILSGSAGEFFPPGRDKITDIEFFSPDLCRTIQFEYDRKTTVEGALGYRYKLGRKLVSNETYEEENSCFNPEPVPEQPLINGLLNVSACKFQAPAYVSYPHFYLADNILIDQFEDGSLKPDPELHESFLSLDPRSGIPLEVGIRMQINGLVRPLKICGQWCDENSTQCCNYAEIKIFKDLNPTFYPMIWFETATRIDGGSTTGRLIVIVSRLHQIIYGLGGLILSISIIILLLPYNKENKTTFEIRLPCVKAKQKSKKTYYEPETSVLSYVQLSKENDYQISHKIEKQQPQITTTNIPKS